MASTTLTIKRSKDSTTILGRSAAGLITTTTEGLPDPFSFTDEVVDWFTRVQFTPAGSSAPVEMFTVASDKRPTARELMVLVVDRVIPSSKSRWWAYRLEREAEAIRDRAERAEEAAWELAMASGVD